MSFAVLIGGPDGRFAGIMQEHGQAQDRIRRDAFHPADRMFPQVPGMVVVLLIVPDHGPDLRYDHRKDLRICPEDPAAGFSAKKFEKLIPDPLGSHAVQIRGHTAQGPVGRRIDREVIDRSEAKRTQDAQSILFKALAARRKDR